MLDHPLRQIRSLPDTIDTPLAIADGHAQPREGPGWRFRLREAALKELTP